MEKIIVVDKFLDQDELNNVVSILKTKRFMFDHKSNGDSSSETPFWSSDLIDEKYLSEYIKEQIEQYFSQKFKLNRLYMNGQTFGQDGSYHTDSNNENDYTFCLYMTDIDKENIEVAGGHLYFKLPDKKYQICYEPIFNRGILFPSNYVHKSTSYSRYIMSLRRVVTWKLSKIN